MNDIVKKSIAIALTVSIFAQSTLLASSLGDILLENTTYAGSWEDPSSGIKYHSGGGIKIKFKSDSQSFPPWIKGSVPGIKAGCNGISIDGGFVSLLGLDDIETQLKDAGAAFAWGILIGLAYSLPGVSDVFAKIQKWARQIQQLLQNACSIGQDFSKNSKAAEGLKTGLQDAANNLGFQEAKTFLSSHEGKVTAVDDFFNGLNDPAKQKEVAEVVGKWFGVMFGSNGKTQCKSSGPVGQNGCQSSQPNVSVATYEEIPMHELLSTTNGKVSLNEAQILNIKLTLMFFGDIAMQDESRNAIAELFDTGTNKISGDIAKAKAKKMLGEGASMGVAKFSLIKETLDEQKTVDVLINGSSEALYIPNYKLAVLKLPQKNANSITYFNLIKEIKPGFETHSNLKLEWGGFYEEGLKQIVGMLNKTILGDANQIVNISQEERTINTDAKYVPVLVPQLNKYVRELRRAASTDMNKKFQVEELTRRIARVNASLATYGLVKELEDRVRQSAYGTQEQKTIFLEYLKQIERISKSVTLKIEEQYTTDKNINAILDREVKELVDSAKRATLK